MLAAAVAARIAVTIVYWPGLFFVGDSFGYLDTALGHTFVGFDVVHPSGYPLLLRLLGLPGFELGTVVVAQHLAGLGTGALLYALLLRLSLPPLGAAAASAAYLLASYPVILEQHILSESFFTLALAAGAYLAIVGTGARALGASGFLVGFAVLIRAVGLAVVPVWLLYVLWRRPPRRALAAGAAAVALPVLAFATAHAIGGRGFGLTGWDGWVLYGRIARIADCRGADIPAETRGVCESAAERDRKHRTGWTPPEYVFSPESPAHRVFGFQLADVARTNATMRAFDLAIIRANPLAYARMVTAETVAFFRTDRPLPLDPGVQLHEHAEDLTPIREDPVVERHVGEYRPEFRGPLDAVLWFDRNARPPRPLLAGLALAPLVALFAAVASRRRVRLPYVAEMIFLFAIAAALVVGATAFVEQNLRYFTPGLPFLAAAGALAVMDLVRLALSVRRP